MGIIKNLFIYIFLTMNPTSYKPMQMAGNYIATSQGYTVSGGASGNSGARVVGGSTTTSMNQSSGMRVARTTTSGSSGMRVAGGQSTMVAGGAGGMKVSGG